MRVLLIGLAALFAAGLPAARPLLALAPPSTARPAPPPPHSPAPPWKPLEVPAIDLAGLEPAVVEQLEEVGERLAAAQRQPSGDAAVYGDAGAVYQAYDLMTAAEACYRNAEALAPADFRWPYLLGVVLEKQGRLEEAATSLERSLAGRDQLYYPGLLRLAAVDLALGRTDDAAARLELARRHTSEDPALLALLGQLALARGKHAEAIEHLTAALRRQPAATRLHYQLAQALRAAGQPEAAQQHLSQAGTAGVTPLDPLIQGVEAQRRGGITWLLEGGKAFAAGDLAGAATAFGKAVASDPGNVAALVNLAAVESKLDQTAAARQHLERAVQLDPQNVNANFNLAVLLIRQFQIGAAEPHLRTVLAQVPGDDQARVELALILGSTNRAPEALDEIEHLRKPTRCSDLRRLLAAVRNADPALVERATALETRLPSDCPP